MSYPYELLRVPGSKAVTTLFELQEKGGGTPIILGNEEDLESDKFAGAFDAPSSRSMTIPRIGRRSLRSSSDSQEMNDEFV